MYAEWELGVNSQLEALLAKELESQTQTPGFYESLGDLFASLEKDSEAVWSYEKNLGLNPWNHSVKLKLVALQEKLLLPVNDNFSFPKPHLYQAFSLFFILFLILFKMKFPRIIFGSLTALTLFFLAYLFWIEPTEGIILQSTYLYPSSTETGSPLSFVPVPSGSKVSVLDIDKKGNFLKIKDLEGRIGFISSPHIRLL